MSVEGNKKLGGLGAILTLAGIVSTLLTFVRQPSSIWISDIGLADWVVLGVGGVTSMMAFFGFILFMVAMYGFSKDYNDRRIFSYILNALVVMIIVAVILGITGVGVILISAMAMFSSQPSIGSAGTEFQNTMTPTLSIVTLIFSLVTLIWIIANYKAFNLLADKSGAAKFRATAKLFLLGQIVTIAISGCFVVLAIMGLIDYRTATIVSLPGGLIQYGGWAYAAKGFFDIKAPPQATQPYTPYAGPNQQVRYCTHCGASNQSDSVYCIRCGQKLS